MSCFVYSGSLWCADCAARLTEWIESDHPDERPPVECPDLPTRNEPSFCAGGDTCANAIELPSGDTIGALIGNPLTDKGFDRVGRELWVARDELTIATLVADHYKVEDRDG